MTEVNSVVAETIENISNGEVSDAFLRHVYLG